MGQRRPARDSDGGLTIAQTFVASSAVTRALLRSARRYARVDATVLITGETGVGKDALARAIHVSGPRRLTL